MNDNNNDNNDNDNNNNNINNNNDNNNDNHNNNDNNNNNDDASGCFFTNVTFTAVAEISFRGVFFSKAIINSLSLTCFSFISFYSELTSLYISTPYTYQVWIYNSIYDMKLTDDIFKSIFNEGVWISITISLKFIPKGPIDYKSALVQVVAWHRTGEKPLPESVLTQFTDAYIRH